MEILNKLKCHKCGNEALGLVNGMWLCGPCIIILQNKINKLKEKFLIEEGF